MRAIVVTWNGAHLLPDCLDSLLAQDLPEGTLEILVVDNASTDGTAELLAEQYPSVRTLHLPRNTGFAGGVAAGTADLLDPAIPSPPTPSSCGSASESQALDPTTNPSFIALLNNDAQFAPDAIRLLIEAANVAEADGERVGAVTATVLLTEPDEQGRLLVQSTGNIVTSAGAAMDRDFRVPLDEASPQREVFGFNGGAALLRTEALREAGGFDASLFLYYEDTDLSWRMREHGWSIIHEHAARATHRHMASTGGGISPMFRYYNTRNSLIVATRHASARIVLASLSRQTAGALSHTLRRDEPGPVRRARWRGLAAYLRRLPQELRIRRIQRLH
ncbi:MAG: glycosyltransferase family 2 protein [Promicromonosporaceae bacterium]|nr:glycosyltransferase family 2 protein [Promicromonosporaceae bacterium]